MKKPVAAANRRAFNRACRYGAMKKSKSRPGCGRPVSISRMFLYSAAILATGMAAQDCMGQTIVRIKNGYALFDSIKESWKSGQKIRVLRKIDGNEIETGIVRLVQFRDKKAAAKVIREVKSLSIAKGDYAAEVRSTAAPPDLKPASIASKPADEEQPKAKKGRMPGSSLSGLDIDTYFFHEKQ